MDSQPDRPGAPANTEIPPDRLEVRVFTLADHAVSPPDGKLYISGGGVDQVFLTQIPGQLPPLHLAVRIRIPWEMTSDRTTLRVRALNGDRNPVGSDPLLEGDLEFGRPPGLRPGDENGVNLVIPLTGFPVQEEGTIFFHLIVGKQLLSVLPLKVRRALVARLAPEQRP